MSNLVALGECTDRCLTWNPAADDPDGEFDYIDLSSVDKDTKRIEGISPIACSAAPSRARQIVKAGDILVSTVRPNLNGVAAVPIELDGATASTGYTVLRPRSDRVDGSYLFHWVKHPKFVGEMVRLATGASYPAVSDKIVRAAMIPLSSLPEQRRIAAILDKADALRAKRREAIAKLDQLLQSVFVNATAGQAGNSATIGELLESKFLLQHKDGNHGSQYPRKEEFGESGVPFLSARNLTDEGAIDLEDTQLLREDKANSLKIGWIVNGDVLLAHNASVGRVALYRGEFDRALVGTSLTVFRPDPEKLRPAFLFMALRADEFQRELTKDMSQTTRNQVPITAQRRLTIQVPEIDVQDKIVIAVEVLKKQKDALLAQSSEMERLFSALQQHAFAGKL